MLRNTVVSSYCVLIIIWRLKSFNRDMRLFEMLIFVIRIIWILSDIWLMFICLKRFVLIVNGWVLCALNNLCYYTENTKMSPQSQMKTLRLSFVNPRKGTSSCSHMFFKIDVLKNFYKFHRKTPILESLFNQLQSA